ncbi:MAG: hypothetical protein HQK54_12810, partial [Oligoflexales bacterium]|nr:hypothetical protein [Oligoflexales bacterium]
SEMTGTGGEKEDSHQVDTGKSASTNTEPPKPVPVDTASEKPEEGKQDCNYTFKYEIGGKVVDDNSAEPVKGLKLTFMGHEAVTLADGTWKIQFTDDRVCKYSANPRVKVEPSDTYQTKVCEIANTDSRPGYFISLNNTIKLGQLAKAGRVSPEKDGEKPVHLRKLRDLIGYDIGGKVLDSETREPLSGMRVQFMNKEVITDDNGDWKIEFSNGVPCELKNVCVVRVKPDTNGYIPSSLRMQDSEGREDYFVSVNNVILLKARNPYDVPSPEGLQLNKR